ncbi:MAG TPA: DUF1571 domain-containing protein [Bacteroidia bacterium]|nr:DUF1571 domain-containing protein [Bacteroidia bacterium]
MTRKYSFFLVLLIFSSPVFSQDKNTQEVIRKMLSACDNLKTAGFVLKSTERMKDGTYHVSEIIVRLQRNPLTVYVYCINPNPGAEAMWRTNEIDNRVLINPNGFPFFNLKLNPRNPLLRKGQHHTIEEIGFDYIANVFKHYISKYKEEFYRNFSIAGTETFDSRNCLVLTYDNHSFSYENYAARSGESVTRIAQSKFVSDFMLLCVNRELKNYDAVKPGQVIKLPVTYGKKIVLYLDKNNYLPIVQMIYDEKGLYEKYEFHSFMLNPKFEANEFNPKNSRYKF